MSDEMNGQFDDPEIPSHLRPQVQPTPQIPEAPTAEDTDRKGRGFSIAALVVFALVNVLGWFFAFLQAFAMSDGCGAECNLNLADTGFNIMIVAPWIVWLVTLVLVVVKLVRKQAALRTALVGLAVGLLVYVLGETVVWSAGGNFFRF